MTDENMNKDKKQGQYGSGSQGTREREENITGSSGVQNKQGQNINQGSTTGQKGGQGMGQQNQGDLKRDQRPQQGQQNRQGEGQQKPADQQKGAGFGTSSEGSDEEE